MSDDPQRDVHELREAGRRDGYRVGRSGIDPDGNPTAGYDENLIRHQEYRDGLREGRTQRINDYTEQRGGHDDGRG